jgi:cobalamin biosynthesis protein CobD/CbiB
MRRESAAAEGTKEKKKANKETHGPRRQPCVYVVVAAAVGIVVVCVLLVFCFFLPFLVLSLFLDPKALLVVLVLCVSFACLYHSVLQIVAPFCHLI